MTCSFVLFVGLGTILLITDATYYNQWPNWVKQCGKLKKIYDKRFEFCFGGKIYAKGTHKICKLAKGAKAVYNFNQKICFDGALYDSNYYGTCFGKLIDYRIQFCWEGEIYSKKEYYMCDDKICEKEPAAATTLPPPPVYYAQRRRRRRRRRRKDYNLM